MLQGGKVTVSHSMAHPMVHLRRRDFQTCLGSLDLRSSSFEGEFWFPSGGAMPPAPSPPVLCLSSDMSRKEEVKGKCGTKIMSIIRWAVKVRSWGLAGDIISWLPKAAS